jgi:hypothetical protein
MLQSASWAFVGTSATTNFQRISWLACEKFLLNAIPQRRSFSYTLSFYDYIRKIDPADLEVDEIITGVLIWMDTHFSQKKSNAIKS